MYTDRIKTFLSAQQASNSEYSNEGKLVSLNMSLNNRFFINAGNTVLLQDFYGEEIDLEGNGKHTCGVSEELLQDFVDGELDELTAHRVERHIGDCQRCHKICTETQDLKNLSKSLGAGNLVAGEIHERLRVKLMEELKIDIDGISEEL